jgi:hypothetical protein
MTSPGAGRCSATGSGRQFVIECLGFFRRAHGFEGDRVLFGEVVQAHDSPVAAFQAEVFVDGNQHRPLPPIARHGDGLGQG